MCGICGFSWEDPELIRRMTETIHHRGPDAKGTRCFEGMSLGNARLSIIDLSTRGNQPMQTQDGRYWIVYNGEIYNFPEIRESLIEKGHRFQSRTDTETVLHCYREYGPGCLDRFNGMFAFAVWDTRERTLFLARDRIGIKPLYYYLKDGKLLFASEIKCILEADCVSRAVDPQSLYHYLGFEFVPAPRTMFQNIYKLRQGHYALYKNGDFKVEKYWELDFPKHRGDPRETRERLFCAMEESVRKRLLADVPVGVFLSGGLDSSTVTGFVTRHYPGKVETFSIGYRDRSFSELPFAERVSRYYGTGHNVLMIDPVSPEDIEKSLYHLDEPMTDLSTIPFHLISAKAREKVKVCLSGEGGDEIFLGYDRFRAAKIHRWYRAVPGWLRSGMIDPLVMRLPDQRQKKGAVNMLKRFIEGGMYPEEVGAMRWQFFLRPETEKALFRPGAAERILMEPFGPLYDLVKECGSRDRVDRDIFVDMKLTMADSVLMKVDKMSMATSLEVRVPFLDHEVVELCASIPGDWKLEGLTTKAVLRKTLKEHDFLPPDIIDRGKQGYSLPVKNWLREDLLDFMTHLLTTSRLIDEYLEPQTVRRLIDEHVRREHNHNHILWALVNVALWYRRFFE